MIPHFTGTIIVILNMLLGAWAGELPKESAARAPESISVGMLWWPADPSMNLHSFVSDVDQCLMRTIKKAAPEIRIMPHEPIHDALYPLMEPATQPKNEQAFAELLVREDVRSRLVRRGLRYLIAFSGSTTTTDDQAKGGMLCGAGYGGAGCLGFIWWNKTTALNAALWDLENGAKPLHEDATAHGTSIVPAFILPVPLPADTLGPACRDLGLRIVEAIRGNTEQPKTE
ncbi:MAG: hypothetical protein L0Z68_06825 [Gammaproteobacteria bacterium]|nr:hypothetical protein [Gammaproteobacteria bacterium]